MKPGTREAGKANKEGIVGTAGTWSRTHEAGIATKKDIVGHAGT